MQKALLFGLLVFAVFLCGCTDNNEPVSFAEKIPEVQSFIAQNPDAEIKAVFFNKEHATVNIEEIRKDCGEQMQEAPYYYVTITDGNNIIKVYLDEKATRVLCLIKPATKKIIPDENHFVSIFPDENQDTPNPDENQEIQPPIQTSQDEAIQNAEKQLEETVCRILPTNAMHLNTVWNPPTAILIPSTLDEQVRALGDNLAFLRQELVDEKGVYANSNYSGDKYYSNCWRDADPNTHLCIIPITMNLTDETGNQPTENGAIKLAFTGALEPLQPDNSNPCPGSGDCPVPKCYPYCNVKAVPTYSRTACEIDFERPCPEKPDSVLCGQCQYKSFWDDATQVSNLGQCRYCPKGTTCYWSVGICGSFSCVSSGGANNNPTNLQKYFISCSGCQTGQRSYYYNGYSYAICNYYSRICTQNNCTDKRSNCG